MTKRNVCVGIDPNLFSSGITVIDVKTNEILNYYLTEHYNINDFDNKDAKRENKQLRKQYNRKQQRKEYLIKYLCENNYMNSLLSIFSDGFVGGETTFKQRKQLYNILPRISNFINTIKYNDEATLIDIITLFKDELLKGDVSKKVLKTKLDNTQIETKSKHYYDTLLNSYKINNIEFVCLLLNIINHRKVGYELQTETKLNKIVGDNPLKTILDKVNNQETIKNYVFNREMIFKKLLELIDRTNINISKGDLFKILDFQNPLESKKYTRKNSRFNTSFIKNDKVMYTNKKGVRKSNPYFLMYSYLELLNNLRVSLTVEEEVDAKSYKKTTNNGFILNYNDRTIVSNQHVISLSHDEIKQCFYDILNMDKKLTNANFKNIIEKNLNIKIGKHIECVDETSGEIYYINYEILNTNDIHSSEPIFLIKNITIDNIIFDINSSGNDFVNFIDNNIYKTYKLFESMKFNEKYIYDNIQQKDIFDASNFKNDISKIQQVNNSLFNGLSVFSSYHQTPLMKMVEFMLDYDITPFVANQLVGIYLTSKKQKEIFQSNIQKYISILESETPMVALYNKLDKDFGIKNIDTKLIPLLKNYERYSSINDLVKFTNINKETQNKNHRRIYKKIIDIFTELEKKYNIKYVNIESNRKTFFDDDPIKAIEISEFNNEINNTIKDKLNEFDAFNQDVDVFTRFKVLMWQVIDKGYKLNGKYNDKNLLKFIKSINKDTLVLMPLTGTSDTFFNVLMDLSLYDKCHFLDQSTYKCEAGNIYNMCLDVKAFNISMSNKTPYELFNSTDFKDFKDRIMSLYPNTKKMNNNYNASTQSCALFEGDLSKWVGKNGVSSTMGLQHIKEISRFIIKTLSKRYVTNEVKGNYTDALRKHFNIIIKNRNDFRHHLVDSTLISLFNNSILQKLKSIDANVENRKKSYDIIRKKYKKVFDVAFPNTDILERKIDILNKHSFFEKEQKSLDSIINYGKIHNDTGYGEYNKDGKVILTTKEAISSLSFTKINRIISDNTKDSIINFLSRHNIDFIQENNKNIEDALSSSFSKTDVDNFSFEYIIPNIKKLINDKISEFTNGFTFLSDVKNINDIKNANLTKNQVTKFIINSKVLLLNYALYNLQGNNDIKKVKIETYKIDINKTVGLSNRQYFECDADLSTIATINGSKFKKYNRYEAMKINVDDLSYDKLFIKNNIVFYHNDFILSMVDDEINIIDDVNNIKYSLLDFISNFNLNECIYYINKINSTNIGLLPISYSTKSDMCKAPSKFKKHRVSVLSEKNIKNIKKNILKLQ